MVGKTKPMEIGSFMAGIGEEQGGYAVFTKVPDTDEVVLIRAMERKTKVKATMKNGKPHILVKVRYESDISEKEGLDIDIGTEEDIRSIEKEFSKNTSQVLRDLISKTQRVKSDIFGFGEHFRAKFPHYWNKNVKTKEDWQDIYESLSVDVKVTTHIRRAGMKAK